MQVAASCKHVMMQWPLSGHSYKTTAISCCKVGKDKV